MKRTLPPAPVVKGTAFDSDGTGVSSLRGSFYGSMHRRSTSSVGPAASGSSAFDFTGERDEVSAELAALKAEPVAVQVLRRRSMGVAAFAQAADGAAPRSSVLTTLSEDGGDGQGYASGDVNSRIVQISRLGSIADATMTGGTVRSETNAASGSLRFLCCGGPETDMAARRRLREDFIREMKIMINLRHPNITTIMGACVENGVEPVLVMEVRRKGRGGWRGRRGLFELSASPERRFPCFWRRISLSAYGPRQLIRHAPQRFHSG